MKNNALILSVLLFLIIVFLFVITNIKQPYGESPAVLPPPSSENPEQSYQCPVGWVNCMPGPDERPAICNDEALQEWAEENCPQFEGIAY